MFAMSRAHINSLDFIIISESKEDNLQSDSVVLLIDHPAVSTLFGQSVRKK